MKILMIDFGNNQGFKVATMIPFVDYYTGYVEVGGSDNKQWLRASGFHMFQMNFGHLHNV